MCAPMKYSDELIQTLRNASLKGMPEYFDVKTLFFI